MRREVTTSYSLPSDVWAKPAEHGLVQAVIHYDIHTDGYRILLRHWSVLVDASMTGKEICEHVGRLIATERDQGAG